jgi:tetratricopeptide (TPR) repeat protein
MLTQPATQNPDELFRRGLEALANKHYQQGIKLIQSAIEQDRQESSSGGGPKMKYLSYLGLALNLSQGRSEEGLKLCEQAARREFFDSDIFCNLGIAYLRHRQKKPAFEAFRKGLALKPGHRRIQEEMTRMERRNSPVFPGLPRDHTLNYYCGMLRHRLRLLFHRESEED